MWSEYMRRTTVKALSLELKTLKAGHDLVLTELGQSWELDSSQILWQWTWQASHFTLVLGRCHNVSKKINSEKQRLLTIHWLVQKQHTKMTIFSPQYTTNLETKKSAEIFSHLSVKNVCWNPVMKLAIKFSFANLHMLATPPSNYCNI